MTSAASELSALLPGYTVERELGRGAMGIVYLARHDALGRLVAVKELQGALASDAATRSRFVVEAKVMAAMDHPHVVPVYDFVERHDRCVLVMEQLPGGTVWDRFVTDGISMPHATAITLATCSAMQHAHDGGVLHRDIKPENLMFDGTGSMKVTDFGIARVVNGSSTKATLAGSVLGTPAYMAPEQAEGKTVGAPVDVYATATMFYEMLSGRLPFDRTDSLTGMLTQRILQDPTPLADVAPHVPAGLAESVMRGLARDPARRTPTAEQFGRDVAEAAAAAWGASWLDASGIVVTGSDSIERAARTGAGRPSGTDDPRSTMLPETSTSRRGSHAAETVVPGHGDIANPSDEAESDGTPPDGTPSGVTASDGVVADGTRSGDIGTESVESERVEPAVPSAGVAPDDRRPETEPIRSAPAAAKVKPQASDRDVGRARADQVDQLIDISEILKAPPRPVAQYLIAAALFATCLAWAWLGGAGGETLITFGPDAPESRLTVNGDRLAEQPIELDLTQPIVVSGVTPGELVNVSFDQLGAPFGVTDTVAAGPDGSATLDTGFLGRITSGAAEATVATRPDTDASVETVETTFDMTATNPWFLTAAAIVSMIIVMFSLAGIESSVRAFRRGRGGFSSFVGLLVTGGLFGGSATLLCTIVFATDRTLVGVAGPAAVGAAGAFALGLATRANRARRRAARQELRHTAIKALAKR